MNTVNTAVVRRAFECWNTRDFAAIRELFAGCLYHSPATGDLRADAYNTYLTALLNAFPDGHIMILDQVAESDKVVIRWSFTGTHKADLMGIAPTGKQVSMTGMSIIQMRDGKIAEAWEEWDNLGMLEKLGVVPIVNFEPLVAV